MAKFIKRLTLVDMSESGVSTVLFKSKKKKRRGSRWLKPAERTDRRLALAVRDFGDELARTHEKSSRKRRDGWLRDGNLNVLRAGRKALKQLTKT